MSQGYRGVPFSGLNQGLPANFPGVSSHRESPVLHKSDLCPVEAPFQGPTFVPLKARIFLDKIRLVLAPEGEASTERGEQ